MYKVVVYWLMTLLIIGFISFLIVLFMANKQAKTMPKACYLNPDDKKHSWVLRFDNSDRKGYLICKACGQIPGEE